MNSNHLILNTDMLQNCPEGYCELLLGMGCFWGVEQKLWQQEGVLTTCVGYAGGETPNPNYEKVCTGLTGHAEVVRVLVKKDRLKDIVKLFWESHDPTQGMRQGNDIGSQYRSCIYYFAEDNLQLIEQSRIVMADSLLGAGFGKVTTEIRQNVTFYAAEEYHQQYLHKNPAGYCGLKGSGVVCAI